MRRPAPPALRFGFTFDGVIRQHMIVKGRSRDTARYSMLDAERPSMTRRFAAWLAPGDFDAEGLQRHSLAELLVEAGQAPAG